MGEWGSGMNIMTKEETEKNAAVEAGLNRTRSYRKGRGRVKKRYVQLNQR